MDSDKKLKACLECVPHQLSTLPEHLLVDILSLLPVKNAVQTSVLSRRWRYLWRYIHIIELTEIMTFKKDGDVKFEGSLAEFYHTFEQYLAINFWRDTLIFYNKFVAELLVAKLKSLKIRSHFAHYYPIEINNLITFGVERNVEAFELAIGKGEPKQYKVPQSIFSVIGLRKLKLESCELKFPDSIHLPCLKTLCFINCTFDQNMTPQTLVSNCRALQNLRVSHCYFCSHLEFNDVNMALKTLEISCSSRDFMNKKIKIGTPCLVCLKIGGFATVGMYSTENLVSIQTVCISLEGNEDFDISWDILNGIRHVHNVEFHLQPSKWDFVHELNISSPQKQMETKKLKLVTSFERPEHLRSICQLLFSFPHLETFHFVVNHADDILFEEEEVECWEHLEFLFSSLLPQLRTVVVHLRIVTEYFYVWHRDDSDAWRTTESTSRYSKNQLKLVKILLANSKTLEKLYIDAELWDDEHFVELDYMLLECEKASPAADIIIQQVKK